MLRCITCQKFRNGLKRINTEEGRLYACGEKHITFDTRICPEYKLNPYIFCKGKGKQFIRDVRVCITRQNDKKCQCKLGKDIKFYLSLQHNKKLVRREN